MHAHAIRIGIVLIVAAVATSAEESNYLTPPGIPGSAAARMRTLNEVLAAQPISSLPYSITNSGAYVAVGNLTGSPGSNGITIVADNVTLDLNGFCLLGVPGSLSAIDIPGNQSSVVIRNGVMRHWGLYGIYATDTDNSTFSGLTSISNGWGANCSGILVGRNNLVSDCVLANSKSFGLETRPGCTIRDCKAYGNQSRGISAGAGSTLTGCSAYTNGAEGIASFNGSSISRCMAYQNLNDGIYGQNCTIRDCAAYQNGANGINAEMCTVAGVSSSANRGYGINAIGSMISGCSLFQNLGHGIRAQNSFITGNTCQQNGYGEEEAGAGIYALGADCRVENNLLLYNDYGIQTAGSGSFIVRNSLSGNSTNVFTNGTQTIGPIEVQTGTITNQNPWTNFEF